MIKKIQKIKEYGIFRDFSWNSALPEFSKVNLFYGLNGSGKSTLATIFDDIKKKEQKYYDGYFKLQDDETGEIVSSNLDSLEMNLYVFNMHFVEDNIGEFSQLKGIVYISEQNKEAKEALELLKKEKKKLDEKFGKLKSEYNSASKTVDKTYASIAKTIKEEFHVIGGLGNKYSNYTKTSFQHAIEQHREFLKERHEIKEIISQIDNLKLVLKDEIKNTIVCSVSEIDGEKFKRDVELLKKLLTTTLKDKLKENIRDDIFSWLEEGYRIHKSSTTCQYCGNIISKERQAYLDNVFNDEMSSLQEGLSNLKTQFSDYLIAELTLIESNFYGFKQSEFTELLEQYRRLRTEINLNISSIINKIILKQSNPFDQQQFELDPQFYEDIDKFNILIGRIDELIKQNNEFSQQFTQRQRKAVDELEKLFVYLNYHQHNISGLLAKCNQAAKNLGDCEVEQSINAKSILEREKELTDVIKAGAEFNTLLSKFLGRDDLQLKYDETSKGYKIIRKESGLSANHLSEGEKTAIAFIYFLTKVQENGNDIKNSIIIFDDPISSFDSNHLFNAYSFIVTYFSNCKQLFILTHNFNFFKLVRKKYKPSTMYLIECEYVDRAGQKVRSSKIVELPKSIKQASSEYYYLFEKIYKFHQDYTAETVIELNDYMQMANTCRKVIESFSSFKIQNVSDLSQKIKGLYKCGRPDGYELTSEEHSECEKIYRFVNSFSHESVFEDSGETDIIFGELDSIVASVLNLIERADKDHYAALIKSIL